MVLLDRPEPLTCSGLAGVSVMTGSHPESAPGRSAKAAIAVTLLALLVLTAVPLAILAAVIMVILGHFVGGLALFGGAVLAAAIALGLAYMTGMHQLRKLLSRASFDVGRLDPRQYTDDEVAGREGADYSDAVRLDPSQYSDIR